MTTIIPAATITAITGATAQTDIDLQGNAIIQMLEAYLGVILVKRDILNEKITLPYCGRVFQTDYLPINSVSKLELLQKDGTYKEYTTPLALGMSSIEFLEPSFLHHHGVEAGKIAYIRLSYNAGYFSSWTEFPPILQEAALELLKYLYASELKAGFQSEHLGDYSYTKGNIVHGLPVEIASMLDRVIL